jgi:transaldolase / glucose-6-phosphate isomerase
MSNPLLELEKYGQSVWLDNISRGIIKNYELENLIESIGLKGITSNPTIFQKAITSGSDYDDQLKNLLIKNSALTSYELFKELAVKDIQDAADKLYPIYERTKGTDGFVSLEVSPELAYNTDATIEEARNLHHKVNRPNVMIKIPATQEGIPAIKQMILEGICINVTLIFSQEVYEEVVEAYISGLEERDKRNESIRQIASVASFFISRIDSMVDKELEKKGEKGLQGKIAIANAKLVYQSGQKLFSSERFKNLGKKGAKAQKLLWASTSTKNPDYSPALYVDELIGKNTVNTLPPETIEAYKKYGKPKADMIEKKLDGAESQMEKLNDIGISFKEITEKLTAEGVRKFADSFKELMDGISKKKESLLTEGSRFQKIYLPENIKEKINARIKKWQSEKILERIWECDPTVWKQKKEDDVELSNRLGWLNLPSKMEDEIDDLKQFTEEIRKDFDTVVLLGMGGSSLAPEVFFKTFRKKKGFLSLIVLDSTHPEAVKNVRKEIDPVKTLFIVASKSGGTTETMSFFHFFFDEVKKINTEPGSQFIAITDAGSSLEKLAGERKFKKIFITPENVGGRYSALTYFGLLPAALIGVDIELLLTRAREITIKCSKDSGEENSPGCFLGAALGELASDGKDKLTIFASKKIISFPAWIEQLVAESTGKEGKGILPVIEDEPANPELYGNDRAFVFIRLQEDDNKNLDRGIKKLEESGFPIIIIDLRDEYDLGKEFYRWEIATALAGSVLQINPFDQPNVQLAKSLANEAMSEYSSKGKLAEEKPAYSENGIEFYGNTDSEDLETAIKDFLAHAREDNYAALMAFLPPSPELDKGMEMIRNKILNKYKIAVTAGYGPRFLHSTGQLHKGDGNTGLFIQFTGDIKNELKIPEKDYTFGILVTAQAQGDMKALRNRNRRGIRIHFKNAFEEGLKKISDFI